MARAIATATTRISPGTTASRGRATTLRSATARRRDLRALLATLFASRGTIMLTAGDEFGRSQRGNNNAYCQDNAITLARLGGPRQRSRGLHRPLVVVAPSPAEPRRSGFSQREESGGSDDASLASWLHPQGRNLTIADWHEPHGGAIAMLLAPGNGGDAATRRVAVLLQPQPVRRRVRHAGLARLGVAAPGRGAAGPHQSNAGMAKAIAPGPPTCKPLRQTSVQAGNPRTRPGSTRTAHPYQRLNGNRPRLRLKAP